jgi:hypothetical protein
MSNIYEQLIKDNNPLRLATPSSGHLVHAKELITDNNLPNGEYFCLENKESSMPSSTDGYYNYILYRTLENGEYYIIYQGRNSKMICGKMTKTDDGEYILV